MCSVLNENWMKQDRLVHFRHKLVLTPWGHFIAQVTRDKEQAMPGVVGKEERAEEAP